MVRKRGLGRGLDALLSDYKQVAESSVEEIIESSKETLQHISVRKLKRGKYQPRKEMPAEALEELSKSIKLQGIIQPIIVRKLDEQSYEIIAGERRWRAAQLAGLLEIPALVRDVSDEASLAIALIENIQRENLNPLEEALALQRLISEFEMTHQATAEVIGRSRAAVSNLLRLLSLNEEVKTFLARGDMEMGHARALLSLEGKDQDAAAQLVIEKNLSARETEKLVKKFLANQANINESLTIDPRINELQQYLIEELNNKVQIKHSSKGKGKLIIRYDNIDELENIIEKIRSA